MGRKKDKVKYRTISSFSSNWADDFGTVYLDRYCPFLPQEIYNAIDTCKLGEILTDEKIARNVRRSMIESEGRTDFLWEWEERIG